MDFVRQRLAEVPGCVGFYYQNLRSGQTASWQEDTPMVAASLIKLPVLVAAHRALAEGRTRADERFVIQKEDKLPSCGALTYLHDGLEVTLCDLMTLMIILSDNTATNLLIRRLGMAEVQSEIRQLGLVNTSLNRLLFDAEASARGIQNYTTAGDMGKLLCGLYRGEIVSPQASADMLALLAQQRLNGKMPFALPPGTRVAHKTGEDSGITHDVGIVYGADPFVACFCSTGTDVPVMERAIQDCTLWLYEDTKGSVL